MLKIRLMRIGAKKRPFYRIVVVDDRAKRTGGYLELLGTYNPLTNPHEIKLNQDKIDQWVKKGAQLSNGFLRITGKAPQRPPRKPKKEKKEEPPVISPPAGEAGSQSSDKTEETPAEEKPTPEAPVETTANTPEVNPEAKDEENTSGVGEKEPASEEKEEIATESETPRNDEK